MLAGLTLSMALGGAPAPVDGACVPTDLGWVDGRLTVVGERGLTRIGTSDAPSPAPTGLRLTGAPEDPPGGPWFAFTAGGTTTVSGRERSWAWSGDPPGFDDAVARLPFAAAADLGQAVAFAIAPSGGAPIAWLASSNLVTRVALWSEPYATEVWSLPLDRRPIVDLVWVDGAQVFAILTGPSGEDGDGGVVFAWRPGLTPIRWGGLPAGPAPVALAVAAVPDPTVGAQAYVVRAAADPEGCSAGTAPPAEVAGLTLPALPKDIAARTGPGFATVGPGCAPPPVPRVIGDGLPEVTRPWREICGATLAYERVTVSAGAWRGPCGIRGHDLVIDGAAAPIDGPVTVSAARARLERLTVRHEVGAAGITLKPGTEGGLAVVDSVITVGGPSIAGIRVEVDRGAALVVIANDRIGAGDGGQPFDGIQVDVREHALLSGLWVTGNTITGRPGRGGGGVRLTGDLDRYVVQNNTIAPGFAVGIAAGVRPTLGRPGGDPHHGFVVANALALDPDSDAATGIVVDGVGQTCVARNRVTGALVGVRVARPRRSDGRELWLSDNRVVGLGADVSGFVYDSHRGSGVLRAVSAAGNRAELGVRDGTVGVVIDRRKKRFAALSVHDGADAATALEARRWFGENGVVVEPLPSDAGQEAP